MKSALLYRRIAISVALGLVLLLPQFPTAPANAATVCLGPAAYPPDLPDCLNPVALAQEEPVKKATEQQAAKINDAINEVLNAVANPSAVVSAASVAITDCP